MPDVGGPIKLVDKLSGGLWMREDQLDALFELRVQAIV